MAVLNCDLDANDEVFILIKSLLNIVSSDRKKLVDVQRERDALLISLKSFDTERLSDDVLNSEISENRRKRTKVEHSLLDKTSESLTTESINDDLNAAFSSSMFDDEVIDPTQMPSNETIKMAKEYNKENVCNDDVHETELNSMSQITSPTVISKCHVKKPPKENIKKEQKLHSFDANESALISQTKSMSIINVSPKWKTVKKETTPRRLFDAKTFDTRKRLSLPRMKQSTIRFPKCEEETYCEGFSTQFLKSQSTITAPKHPTALTRKIKSDPIKKSKNTSFEDDSVIAIVKDTIDVISIDESESSQELYQHVFNDKKEKNEIPEIVAEKSPKRCADCDEYHRMLGRNIAKITPRKYGVCSKHRRNLCEYESPPGLWYPKIDDSDNDEETPFDPRFIRK